MSRIDATLSALKTQGRKALIPYVTAGFPQAGTTVTLMHAMAKAGSDIIELGVPFSDPSADGPVIQKAGDKALALGIGTVQVLAMVREFRQNNSTTPVVLMGYANPVERYDQKHGADSFIRDAATAKAISKVADAVVIGSRLIQLIDAAPADRINDVAREFLSGIRQALDA